MIDLNRPFAIDDLFKALFPLVARWITHYVPLETMNFSAAWSGVAKAASVSVIDLSAEYGLPDNVKAVSVTLIGWDETVGVHFGVCPGNNLTYPHVNAYTPAAGVRVSSSGVVACDSNGDVGFFTDSELDGVALWITGYWV